MQRLPALTAKQFVRIVKRLGFQEDRQKGSHLVLFNPVTKRRCVVPMHAGKTIKRPLLRTMIEKDLGLAVEEFLRFL